MLLQTEGLFSRLPVLIGFLLLQFLFNNFVQAANTVKLLSAEHTV